MTAKIEIYTGPVCSYCDLAKELLNSMGANFIEIKLSSDCVARIKVKVSAEK